MTASRAIEAAADLRALPSWRFLSGMKRLGQAGLMTPEPVTYPGYRFPAEIISLSTGTQSGPRIGVE
jgi:hypothetical protein